MTVSLRVPAEWEKQEIMWTAFPSSWDDEQWGHDRMQPAREEFTQMVRAIAQTQRVEVCACGDEPYESAKETFAADDNVGVSRANFGDIWFRDIGPVFAVENGKIVALRFIHNGWGDKYFHEHDDVLAQAIADKAGVPARMHEFVLEGGSLDHNGEGVILTTKECILNPNRNPSFSKDDAENALKNAFGAHRIVWLDAGMVNDHTDGHVDNIARFISANHVLCQKASGEDDPNAEIFKKIASDLRAEGFRVTQIPSPGRVTDKDGDVVPASHMNFIIANDCVVVPIYNTPSQEEALKQLQELFPDRKVVGVSSVTILTGGGSFHCITQQQPYPG